VTWGSKPAGSAETGTASSSQDPAACGTRWTPEEPVPSPICGLLLALLLPAQNAEPRGICLGLSIKIFLEWGSERQKYQPP